MKFVLIPDSFKGTLSSARICGIISEQAEKIFPCCEVVSIPVADGGEGSVDCFLEALGGEKVFETVMNPYFEEMEAFYGLIDNGETAVFEMASCAGLPLVEDRRDPSKTTTFGVGQLMLSAAQCGVKRMIVGLGGSCTNDGGCGAAAAAGVKFYNKAGKCFAPVGGTLSEIERIDFSSRDPSLSGIEIITMCDIDNPMCGATGAACIFGPQKGADPEMVSMLDDGLRHLNEVIIQDKGVDYSCLPGAGAAGAMGAGMMAFFGSTLRMGIETVLDTVKFEEIIKDADMVFTGEGKLDTQSIRGKVVIGVGKRAKPLGIPVTAIVGGVESGTEAAFDMGVTAVFPINRLPQDFSVSRYKSEENLAATAENIFRFIRCLK